MEAGRPDVFIVGPKAKAGRLDVVIVPEAEAGRLDVVVGPESEAGRPDAVIPEIFGRNVLLLNAVIVLHVIINVQRFVSAGVIH